MADEVDASVDRVEATAGEAHADLAGRQARFEQLRPRHDAVMATRQRRDDPIGPSTVGFAIHTVLNPAVDLSARG